MTLTFEDCQKATVRIYKSGTKQVCGTGFLVHQRCIMTCAHVVNAALGRKKDTEESQSFPDGQVIKLDFPKFPQLKDITGEVIVWVYPTEYSNSDIALLRLNKPVDVSPIILKTPLELKSQEILSPNDECRIWGFPNEFQKATGLATKGKFTTTEQLSVYTDESRIIGGFSGSPVWSESTKQVVGMIVKSVTRDTTKVSNGGRYDASGFACQTAFSRTINVLSDIWYGQGLFIKTCKEHKLWEDYREELLEAYDSIPDLILDNEPETLEILIERMALKPENLLHFVLSFYVNSSASKSKRKALANCLTNLFPLEELKKRYGALTKKDNKQKSETNEKEIEGYLWIFISELENSDQVQLSGAHLLKGRDINSLKQLNIDSVCQFDRSDITQEISAVLKKILRQAKKAGVFLVEVFLPYDYLDLEPDGWFVQDKYGKKPLGASHPLVIRVLDRVLDDDEFTDKWRSWQRPWNSKNLNLVCQKALLCCDRPADELVEALEYKKVMGLSIKSPPENHDNEPLPMIMREGVPVAFWLRKRIEACECNDDYYRMLAKTKLQDLPQKLKFMRNAAPKNPEHLARHLTLLWDDPTVAPPPNFDFSFVDTAQKL